MSSILLLPPPARRRVSLFAVLLALGCHTTPVFSQASPGAIPGIKITVREGEGALNNIRTLRAKEPVVVVTDVADKPVAGAQVTFLLPDLGASGMFGASGSTLTIASGSDGVAVGRGLRPNNVVGQFQIRVSATYHGQTARAVVNQTNAAPAKASSNAGRTALILALIGGGGAGLAVGLTRGNKTTTTNQTGTSISAGGSTFGPPR